MGVREFIAWTFSVMFSIVRFLRPAGGFDCVVVVVGADMMVDGFRWSVVLVLLLVVSLLFVSLLLW